VLSPRISDSTHSVDLNQTVGINNSMDGFFSDRNGMEAKNKEDEAFLRVASPTNTYRAKEVKKPKHELLKKKLTQIGSQLARLESDASTVQDAFDRLNNSLGENPRIVLANQVNNQVSDKNGGLQFYPSTKTDKK
jgi:phage pi2 protein 07